MDRELNNMTTAIGTYNAIETTISSNTTTTNLISGLTLNKVADKQNWIDGPLTYTITLNNTATETYENPILSDIIDTTLVNFIDGTVTIDGVPATSEQYNYNTETHTLTVNLTSIATTTNKVVTFQVEKAT